MESILVGKTEKQSLIAIKSDTESIKATSEQIKEDTTSLKTEVTTIKTDLGTANTNIATTKTNTETLKTETAAIKQKINDVMIPILKRIDDTRKRYGYRIKKSEADPAKRIEYIYDAIGMTPAKLTANKTFDYGSWGDVWFIKDNYPCMVKNDGKEDYKLDPNNYAKKAKDGTASDYANLEYAGNAMSAIPLCWVQRYEENGYEYFVTCQTQYDDSYKAYAHTRQDGTIANYFYHAMFKGSVSGTGDANYKLRSIGGQMCKYQTTAAQEITYAKRTGAKYSIRSWSQHCLLADLCTLISKTDNSQAAFGAGHTTGYVNDASKNYGHYTSSGNPETDAHSLITAGQFAGFIQSHTSGAEHVKVFHIEDLWGDRWERLLGIAQQNGIIFIKMTPEVLEGETADSLTSNGYNLTGKGYAPMKITIPNRTEGWQKDTYTSEFGRVPQGNASASDNTYVTDYHWINHTRNEPHIGIVGGSCGDGSRCGVRCLGLYALASDARWHLGGSLVLIP